MTLRRARMSWLMVGMSLAARAGVAGAEADAKVDVSKKTSSAVKDQMEDLDRSVDQVALSSQKAAIAQLTSLLKKYRKTDQEPTLLARLAEAYQQDAAIRFRIAHGRSHRKNTALDLNDYNKSMKASVATLDDLITAFPNFPDLHEAYYLRAKAFDEVSNKEAAKRDYLHLVTAYPESSYVTASHMRLAEYAIDDNQYEVAIQHLGEIEKHPEDPQWPFAIYKLGWSHYNLGNMKKALGYLERHVAYYNAAEKGEKLEASDEAMRENTLMDVSLFYYEGYEKKKEGFEPMDAYAYFKGVEKGPLLGKMLSRYTRLLRAGNFDVEMLKWKKLILEKEINRPETLEVVMAVFEDRVTKRLYEQLGDLSADLVRIYKEVPATRKSEPFEKARATLIQTAENLQALTIKNKNATEIGNLASSLSQLYIAFTQIVEPSDPRVPKAHYNLAEAYFQIGDFPAATEHYRWVVDNWRDEKTFDVASAALRAIAARYEVLRKQNIIPQGLEARKLASAGRANVDKLLAEWVTWIDAYPSARSKGDVTFANYAFEANRSLYKAGDIERADERFLKFAESTPDSEFAIPSLSLVLDTQILNEQWDKTYGLTKKLKREQAWPDKAFSDKLAKLERDSYFKMIEIAFNAKDYRKTLSMSDGCADKYAGTERAPDCQLLSARAALAMGQTQDAAEHLTRLIQDAPGSDAAEAGLIQRAKIEEGRLDMAGAARDYRRYAEKNPGADANLRERALWLTWIADDKLALAETLRKPDFCQKNASRSLTDACDRYAAVLWLRDPKIISDGAGGEERLDWNRAVKGPRDNGAIWAMAALKWNKSLESEDRMKLQEILAQNWDRVEPMTQFQILTELPDIVRESVERNRVSIMNGPKLKAEKSSIKKRLARIEEAEDVATKLIKLPWTRVRAEILNETAEAYIDLSNQLRAIPAPKELPASELESYSQALAQLAIPFEDKAQDIRRKAFEIAMKQKIERDSYRRIANVFFRDNPSQAKKFKGDEEAFLKLEGLGLKTLQALDEEGQWQRYKPEAVTALAQNFANDPAKKARFLRWGWWKSLQSGAYQQTAWYLKEAQDAALFKSAQLGLMKALSLHAVGERAEAFALMDEVKPALAPQVASVDKTPVSVDRAPAGVKQKN